jgi:shikimate dehydrogenase
VCGSGIVKAALIGNGIAASLTPALHEAEGRAHGSAYRYGRFDLAGAPEPAVALQDAMTEAKAADYVGVNVTYPYKQQIIALLDDLSDGARDIGSVNTVVFRDGRAVGHNTDYVGFHRAFMARIGPLQHDTALLLGAGGAGGAVGLAMLDAGVSCLYVHDHDACVADALRARLARMRPQAEVFVWSGEIRLDGVINATPMGMASHPGQAIDLDDVPHAKWVGDIVYFPHQTPLLQSAAARGLHVMTGGGMAVGQAAAAFELFTGLPADVARMTAHFHTLTQEVPA